MPDNESLKVWYDRWLALQQAMIRLEGLIDTVVAPSKREPLLRRTTLRILIQELQKFVGKVGTAPNDPDGLFVYLYNNLKSEHLKLPDEYPADYVFRTLLDQIGFDTDIIASAAAQRLFADDTLVERLLQADLLAQKALKPAIDAGLLRDETTALTFLTGGARARVIPYASVALIAIPFTATTVDQDLLATAHEAGHYVYWHGQFAPTIAEMMVEEGIPEWCRKWAEEMFADIYGTIVAGPPYALSGQDILLDDSAKEFMRNDYEHPVAPLRPRIYAKVLSQLGDNQRAWSSHLKRRWESAEERRKKSWQTNADDTIGKARFWRKGEGDLAKPLLDQVIDLQTDVIAEKPEANLLPVDKAITIIYRALAQVDKQKGKSVVTAAEPNGWLSHSNAPGRTQIDPDLQELYTGFSTYLKAFPLDDSKKDLEKAPDESHLKNTLCEAKLELIKEKLLKPGDVVSLEQWAQLITWGGWVTRGPQEVPNPPRP